jgi:toxin ParE1/3/4
MKIIWTAQAFQDLLLVREHIEKDNKVAAARIANQLRIAAKRLAAHPEIGRPGRVGSTPELIVPSTPYLLPYRVRENYGGDFAIIHGAQEWPERFLGMCEILHAISNRMNGYSVAPRKC